MATHSRILAWKMPWTKEPGGLQSMGSQRVTHDWATNTHSEWINSQWLNLMLTNTGLLGRLLPPKSDGVSEDYPLAQSHSGWGSGLSHQQGCHPPSPPNHKGMSNRSGCRILITLITPLRAELTFPWWFLHPIPALSMSMHNLTEFSNSTRKHILLNLFHRCLFWNTLQFMENLKK